MSAVPQALLTISLASAVIAFLPLGPGLLRTAASTITIAEDSLRPIIYKFC
jgi:hypothetical protein